MLDALLLSVAQVTAAAFSGVCLYIGLVQHPVRMRLDAAASLEDFRAVIPRAEKVQAPLLVVCLVSLLVQVIAAPLRWPVVVSGLLLLAVLIFTLAAVLPINRLLVSGSTADHRERSTRALTLWGRRHTLRTVLAIPGSLSLWF